MTRPSLPLCKCRHSRSSRPQCDTSKKRKRSGRNELADTKSSSFKSAEVANVGDEVRFLRPEGAGQLSLGQPTNCKRCQAELFFALSPLGRRVASAAYEVSQRGG